MAQDLQYASALYCSGQFVCAVMALKACLATVDVSRDDNFVNCIVALLGQVDVTEPSHLKAAKMEDFNFEPQPSAGKIAFLRMALAKCAPVKPPAGVCSCLQCMLVGGFWQYICTGGEASENGGLESCFLRALSKRELPQKPAHEHVDISVKLEAAGLLEHLPSEVWPPMNAVRELNSKIKNLQKAGQEVAFVAVDLCKCAFVLAVLLSLLGIVLCRAGFCPAAVASTSM